MINLLGFLIGGVSGMIYTTISIFGIVMFWVDGFVPEQWQVRTPLSYITGASW
jgi:hypothetical protein